MPATLVPVNYQIKLHNLVKSIKLVKKTKLNYRVLSSVRFTESQNILVEPYQNWEMLIIRLA